MSYFNSKMQVNYKTVSKFVSKIKTKLTTTIMYTNLKMMKISQVNNRTIKLMELRQYTSMALIQNSLK